MGDKQIHHILSATKLSIGHPLFFTRIFMLLSKNRRLDDSENKEMLKKFVLEEFDEITRRLDRSCIQESCAVRNVLRSRRIAMLLVDNHGELRFSILKELIILFKSYLYSLGPHRQYDAIRQEHILKVLELLHGSKEIPKLLKKIVKPFSHKQADQIIRDTLQLPHNAPITDAHARRAALAAWMCYLRQNIGSCFATAPAIIIHDEQPDRFLRDIDEILSTGRLKRTFGGIEYAVPLSWSWGNGDLKKPIALYQTKTGWMPEIWYSPGLLAAFSATKAFPSNANIREKIAQVKKWIFELLKTQKNNSFYYILNAEEIIRRVLLKGLGISEEDLDEYANRTQGMLQSAITIQIPKVTKGKRSLGETCAQFHHAFDTAKNAFKTLADNALLKSWEFTVASFAETKAEFTRWNLYSSLGLGPEEQGGIGQCIYQILREKIEQCNAKVQDIQYDYEQVHAQIQMLETRMRTASNEKELHWLKIEYQALRNEFFTLQEIRDSNHQKAKRFANLFDLLTDWYIVLFRDYFQEVYDADMHDVKTSPFDDSPAGFRLLFKHGRSNTSQWTRINNSHEFIDALSSFFVATEPHIASEAALNGIERDFSEIVTSVINHIKTKEFLETAFYRMATAHKTPVIRDPLENLDKIEKKPWVYTSGGAMTTLLSCYYKNDTKPQEVGRWVENETELLVFLIDTVKQLPSSIANLYLNENRSALLMHSPTHAFLLKPVHPIFKSAWQSDIYTYTWIRDHYLIPSQNFINQISLDEEMMKYLIQKLSEKIPLTFRHHFQNVFEHMHGSMGTQEFRFHLLHTMEQNRGLNVNGSTVLAADEIDSLLFMQLPLFRTYQLRDRIIDVFMQLPGIHDETIENILNIYDQIPNETDNNQVIGSQQFQDICKSLLCLSTKSTSSPHNYHLHVSRALQKLGYAVPSPLIFADTNWIKDQFACLVNPGTGRLELWRVDCTGTIGYPMSAWNPWLDGSRRDLTWGIYNHPQEYGQT